MTKDEIRRRRLVVLCVQFASTDQNRCNTYNLRVSVCARMIRQELRVTREFSGIIIR